MRQFGGSVFFFNNNNIKERKGKKISFLQQSKKQQSEDVEIPRRVLTPDEFAEKWKKKAKEKFH